MIIYIDDPLSLDWEKEDEQFYESSFYGQKVTSTYKENGLCYSVEGIGIYEDGKLIDVVHMEITNTERETND